MVNISTLASKIYNLGIKRGWWDGKYHNEEPYFSYYDGKNELWLNRGMINQYKELRAKVPFFVGDQDQLDRWLIERIIHELPKFKGVKIIIHDVGAEKNINESVYYI